MTKGGHIPGRDLFFVHMGEYFETLLPDHFDNVRVAEPLHCGEFVVLRLATDGTLEAWSATWHNVQDSVAGGTIDRDAGRGELVRVVNVYRNQSRR